MKYSESLKKYSDFGLVYKEGRSLANKDLVMYVREIGRASWRGRVFRAV